MLNFPDRCDERKGLRCDPESNECVCKPGFMPVARYPFGFNKRCQARASENAVCCKPPFQRSSLGGCFYVSEAKVSRSAAELQCKSMGAQLAVFKNIGSGCQKLKALRSRSQRPLISREAVHIAGVESGEAVRRGDSENESRRRVNLARKCGTTDGKIPSWASGDRRVRERGGANARSKGCAVSFIQDTAGDIDVVAPETRLRFVCEKSASTVDTSRFRWSSWIDSYGGRGNQYLRLSKVLRNRKVVKSSGICSCPVSVQCRFSESQAAIPRNQGTVANTVFTWPLRLNGENTGLGCQRARNGDIRCPRFQCRFFCPGGTGSCADANDCDDNSICRDRENGHRCEPKPQETVGCLTNFNYIKGAISQPFRGAKCVSSGDPHTSTFDSCFLEATDGKRTRYPRIDFQGVCKYQMVACEKCDDPWWIIADNWKKDQPESRASWTKSITFEGCGTEIRIDQRGDNSFPSFYVNNVEDDPNIENECITCSCTGSKIVCTTRFGVQFSFDGDKTAEVIVDQSFANKVNGICGNFNGNGPDDFLMKDGSTPEGDDDRERERNLGQQWTMNMDDEDSDDCYAEPDVLPECTADQAAITDAAGTCGMINNATLFPSLNDVERNNFFMSCKTDYCTTNNPADICSWLESVTDFAEEKNPSLDIIWRPLASINCPLPTCRQNEEFGRFTCQNSCRGDQVCSTAGPRRGCHCDDNSYLSSGRCVAASECGCQLDDGHYIPVGESRIVDCNTVHTCVAGAEDELPSIQTGTVTKCRRDECRNNKCYCGTGRMAENGGCVDKPVQIECPRGWIKANGLCVALLPKKTWWINAAKLCSEYGDTATLFRVDSEGDKKTLEAVISLIAAAYAKRHTLPDHVHLWIGGCSERSEGRTSPALSNGIPTSVDMPMYDGIGPGPFDSGCMEVVYDTRNKNFAYRTDDVRQSTRYAMCSIDPSRNIPTGCSGKMSPIKTKWGAALLIQHLRDLARFKPEVGYQLCHKPTSFKCFDDKGNRVGNRRGRLLCSAEKGFLCRGSQCRNYKVEICCKKSENVCDLFPNACDSTQRCTPLYYAHTCGCAQGYSAGSDGSCVEAGSQCMCGCSGDPHCYGCGHFYFDFMGKCRYKAITNKCSWMPKRYPSLEVIAKHRVCGEPDKNVTCAENLEIRICQTEEKDNADDCIKSKMQTTGGMQCTTTYDSNGWMSSQIGTHNDGKTCYFEGIGLKLKISGVKWHAILDQKWKDNICGYCGAWSSQGNGLVDKDGTQYTFNTRKFDRRINGEVYEFDRLQRADATLFGDSWLYDDFDNPKCSRTTIGNDCTEEEKATARTKCAFIKVIATLFGDDDADAEEALAECTEDVCKATDDFICISMKNYAEKLTEELGATDVVPDWRGHADSPCGYDCNEDNEVPSNGNTPQSYCDHREGEITDCVCAAGYMYDEAVSKCVLNNDCSCKTTMGTEVIYILNGKTVYNTEDCGEILTCNAGEITRGTSQAAQEATCDKDGLTGCREGFTGDGIMCSETPDECSNGWTASDAGCIRIFEDPKTFPLAAEECRKESGELVEVDAAGAEAVITILKARPEGTEFFVSGVCGQEYNRLHDRSVPGGDSYIPSDDIDCSEADNIDKCFTVKLSGGSLTMNPSDCLTPQNFICEKKPNDDFEWTPDCNGNVVDPTSATPDDESRDTLMDEGCVTCEVPRAIECTTDSGDYNPTDGTCDVNNYFEGSACSVGACADYQVRLLCPKKIDECAEGVDMCGTNEVCRDTELGYECLCDFGSMPVIEDGEQTCKRLDLCQMNRYSSSADLFLKRFTTDSSIPFNEQCSFTLLSNALCGDTPSGPRISILFVNKETSAEPRHIIILVNDDVFKIYADLTVKVNNVVVSSDSQIQQGQFTSLKVTARETFTFLQKDNKLSCNFVIDQASKIFKKIDCYADETFRSCGVCRTDGPTSNQQNEINDFFEDNRAPNTEARCDGMQPGGSSTDSVTFGTDITVQATTTPVQVTTTPAGPIDGEIDDCVAPECTTLAFQLRASCLFAVSDFATACVAGKCDLDQTMCQFLQAYIVRVNDLYTAGNGFSGCSLDTITPLLNTMQTDNECQTPALEPEATTAAATTVPPRGPRPTQAPTTQPPPPTQAPTTQPPPTTQAPTTQTPECLPPDCGTIRDVFESCVVASSPDSLNNYVSECQNKICNDNFDICQVIEDVITSLENKYKDSVRLGSCNVSNIQEMVQRMRTMTNCGLPSCGDPNEIRMLNPPRTQRTCSNPNEPRDSTPSVIELDPVCVCKSTYVIDESDANMACVPKTDCGCYYNGQRVQFNNYVLIDDNCMDTKLCKPNGELVPIDRSCVANAACENKKCVCNEGYMGDGYTECKPEIEFPDKYCAYVYDTEGEVNRFRCNCKMGYAASCDHCVDIDECALRTADCGEGTKCINTPGSYKCECLNGFERSTDKTCTDIKECSQTDSPCSKNSTCFEAKGGFYCKCCAGFSKDSNGVCQPTDADNVPEKCCVCTLADCYKTPAGQPDAICYTDENGLSVTFENFRTAYIHLCLEDKSFNFTGYTYGECDKPDIIVTTPTPGSTPVQGTTEAPPPSSPCGDGICTISETVNDKTSGEICLTATQKTYPDLCFMKRSICRGNENTPPTINEGDYTLGPCPQTTTTPPPTTSGEYIFGDWSLWSICNVSDCSEDAGIQHRERTVSPTDPTDSRLPPAEDCIQYRSCTKPGCEDPGNPSDKTPENCDRILCAPGLYEPVCGRKGNDPDQTFDNECLLKRAACGPPVQGYTITKIGPCDSDEDGDTEETAACPATAIIKTVHFNTTRNGVTCVFENVQMSVCAGLCMNTEGVTNSDKCCQGLTFYAEPRQFKGICSDNSEHTFTKKEPKTCGCVDMGAR